MLRGVNRQDIFEGDADCLQMIACFRGMIAEFLDYVKKTTKTMAFIDFFRMLCSIPERTRVILYAVVRDWEVHYTECNIDGINKTDLTIKHCFIVTFLLLYEILLLVG